MLQFVVLTSLLGMPHRQLQQEGGRPVERHVSLREMQQRISKLQMAHDSLGN